MPARRVPIAVAMRWGALLRHVNRERFADAICGDVAKKWI